MSGDLTHRDIAERIAMLEVRLDERFAVQSRDLEALRKLLKDTASQSAEQREFIAKRLERLERRAEVTDAVDEATAKQADKWRARVYVAFRYVLPPSAAAGIAIWFWEHLR